MATQTKSSKTTKATGAKRTVKRSAKPKARATSTNGNGDLRPQLRDAYLHVVNNWAVGTEDVASALGIERDAAKALLNRLASKRLVEGAHVNNERTVTWQSFHDIENSDVKETRAKARADFDAAFPKGEPVREGSMAGRKGATGPRYTDAQIKKGMKAREQGKSNVEVARIAGVKSPAYFSKTLQALGAKPQRAIRSGSKAPAKAKGSKGSKASGRKVVRRTRKAK